MKLTIEPINNKNNTLTLLYSLPFSISLLPIANIKTMVGKLNSIEIKNEKTKTINAKNKQLIPLKKF